MKVYEAVAQAIADEGVSVAFNLTGHTTLSLVSELLDGGRVRVIHSLHEGTALGMAEGYRRAAGKPTICITTGGPAVVNLTLFLYEAARSRTPIVVLSGTNPTTAFDSVQNVDHGQLAAAAGAGHIEITSPAHALTMTREAFAQAERERRPVLLDIASDVQMTDIPDEYTYESAYRPQGTARPVEAGPIAAPDMLAAAVERIARCSRPVIIAGRGAMAAGARGSIEQLADRIGALLATTMPAHGLFGANPYNIGIVGQFAWPFALDLIREADLVIGIGASLNRYTTQDVIHRGHSVRSRDVLQIDLGESAPLGDGGFADVHLRGDAETTVRALLELLPQQAAGYRGTETAQVLAASRTDFDLEPFDIEPGTMDPRRMGEVLEAELPDPCGIAISSGHMWSFPLMYLKAWRGAPHVFAYDLGSIGVTSAIGIGAAFGQPDRPMAVFEGDGSALMSIHNAQVMARYELPVLWVVFDDEAYGAELHKARGQRIAEEFVHLYPADLAAIAECFGIRGHRVESIPDLRARIKDFAADPRPTLLDCRVSRNVVSLPVRYTDYPRGL